MKTQMTYEFLRIFELLVNTCKDNDDELTARVCAIEEKLAKGCACKKHETKEIDNMPLVSDNRKEVAKILASRVAKNKLGRRLEHNEFLQIR